MSLQIKRRMALKAVGNVSFRGGHRRLSRLDSTIDCIDSESTECFQAISRMKYSVLCILYSVL